MKIRITVCDPAGADRIGDDVQRILEESMTSVQGLTQDEYGEVLARRTSNTWEALEEFISYKDTIVVEIDTTARTARVIPISED